MAVDTNRSILKIRGRWHLGNPTVVTGVGVTHLRYPVHTS
jgi:hypothetical protein